MNDANLNAYKKANAIFKKEIKSVKRQCFSNFSSKITSQSPTKKVWSDLKAIYGNPSPTINTLKSNNSYIQDPNIIAQTFAEHWSSLFSDANFSSAYVVKKRDIMSLNYIQNNPSHSELDHEFTMCELEYCLHTAKGKTPGPDKISYQMISNLPLPGKQILLNIYNKIFSTGHLPLAWRTAIIIRIPKPNSPNNDLLSYRPISLLSCLSKTFDKMLARRLMWVISSKNLIKPNQVGFKAKHSTIDSLLHLQHFTADALSTKNHTSILSIDFEKAFDRIGVHSILEQMMAWNVSHKLFNILKAFMTNRTFRVRVKDKLSKFQKLHNGIPQGSPISVVLFTIAFDKLIKVVLKYRSLQISIYADDAIIFSKEKNLQTLNDTFKNVLNEIKEWGNTSGATLSLNKCKILHICRKHHCLYPQLKFNNSVIEVVSSLKILGVYFDKSFTFKQHCIYLRKSLENRLNIIKLLTCKNSFIHTNILINVTRALILSKIDYGLPIYGWCAKSNIKLLQGPYHLAIRRAINAFPTSPIKCILAESGLPSISSRIISSSYLLIPKLFFSPNKILLSNLRKALLQKKKPKLLSTIRRCVTFSRDLNINNFPVLHKTQYQPPWLLKKSTINTSLHKHCKASTNEQIYQQIFLQESAKFSQYKWLFTDGSKTELNTAFAVVDSKGSIITGGHLPTEASIFAAEATAVLKALEYALGRNGRFCVCTDSLSTINAVKNIYNSDLTIRKIRSICIKYNDKFVIWWVPSHKNIKGNEEADSAAKFMCRAPSYLVMPRSHQMYRKIIANHLRSADAEDWQKFVHRYKRFKPYRITEKYPNDCSRKKCTYFIRLRIGHTKPTHQHLLTGNPSEICPTCRIHLTVDHLLDDCTALAKYRSIYFGHSNPSSYLSPINSTNINLIWNFFRHYVNEL